MLIKSYVKKEKNFNFKIIQYFNYEIIYKLIYDNK